MGDGPLDRALGKPGSVPTLVQTLGLQVLTDQPMGDGQRWIELKIRDVVREVAAQARLQAVAVVAVDGVWSALRCKRVAST
jgi:hypothetical protein